VVKAWPHPTEQVILTVNGANYSDWESVMVRCHVHEAPPFHCRFTCSEGIPIAGNFAKMQIMPGMDCTVTLAGQLAFTGKVETRQVYYDAHRHHIEIQCASLVDVVTSSVISKTMEWKDKTIEQVLKPQLQKLGVNLTWEGGSAPQYKFKRLSAIPGESLFDFADSMARMVGVHFSSNEKGEMVGIVGPTSDSDSVTEGKDILIGREILYRPNITSYMPAATQGTGDNQQWGPKVSHMPFNQEALQAFAGLGFGTAPAMIRNEMATADKQMLQGRTGMEGAFMEGDKITVFATVQGFLRPSGGLWRRNQQVVVNSPMLVMLGKELTTKSVVFTQDNSSGSRTLLELCNPAAMGQKKPGAVQ
jgi:prophage tail gpP-like protein